MKKLLSVLAAVGLTATASSAVVACGSSKKAEEVKDSFTVQTSAESVWGGTTKDGKKIGAWGLEQLFEQSKDANVQSVAKYVANKLGLDVSGEHGWHTLDKDGNPIDTKTVTDEWTKDGLKNAGVKDGQELTQDQLQSILSTKEGKFESDDAFQAAAKKGGEFDILIQKRQGDDGKTKVVLLHVTFKAPAAPAPAAA